MTTLDVSMRDRINACWVGKSVGGTLGLPFEGLPGPFDVWYYTPVPTAMLPNDDLDLQVVWACVMNDMSQPRVDRYLLAEAWERHVEFPFDEYAVAKRNMRLGLQPPDTGSYDNWFANGMGAAIRTELWACLAPGNSELAAAFAYEDACVDHADEGIWAAVFFAALQSLAFIESDPDLLLDLALERIPGDSLIHRAVCDVRHWVAASDDWLQIRSKILEKYDHDNFTDVTANVAFTVMAWLLADGNFSKGICVANNCGRDTDCTAATVGALMAIIDPGCIPDRWIEPIGNTLVLSPEIRNLNHVPATLEELTDLVIDLRSRLRPHVVETRAPQIQPADISVAAELAFVPKYPTDFSDLASLPESAWRSVHFPGSSIHLPPQSFMDEVVLVRFPVRIGICDSVRILFNTAQECRVWVDGEFAFARQSGIVSPSFQRSIFLANQYKDLILSPGMHIITAAVRRSDRNGASWVFGVGDSRTLQWLTNAVHTVCTSG